MMGLKVVCSEAMVVDSRASCLHIGSKRKWNHKKTSTLKWKHIKSAQLLSNLGRGRKLKGGREGWREQRNQQREEDPTGDKKKRSEKQKRIEKERIYGGYCGTQRRARSDLNGEILKLTSISSNNVLRLVIVSIGTLKGDEYVMVTVNVR
ncbi:hypothetical protein M8C21_021146 [Ambrosia artemisiifolia]|uniref:Uncharacterized protein n=1 Tax=Ambrosia artemisiifolia TaxID=4212 RepID=A0AAD5DCB5_AMBAR|nr:hypothetical protein M8C21_021146 [Ambrosia artemisiifolia]